MHQSAESIISQEVLGAFLGASTHNKWTGTPLAMIGLLVMMIYDLCTFSCHQGNLLIQTSQVLLREHLKIIQVDKTVSFFAVETSGVTEY